MDLQLDNVEQDKQIISKSRKLKTAESDKSLKSAQCVAICPNLRNLTGAMAKALARTSAMSLARPLAKALARALREFLARASARL